MNSIELFAGAGGLALGCELAGFKPLAVFEWDKSACATIRHNQQRDYPLVREWPVHENDVRAATWETIEQEIDLVSGGPPCQPFSMGGKHQAHDDTRDMFPVAVDVVRQLKPKAFIFENVKGLTRATFANYFQYVQLQLRFPAEVRKRSETWEAHHARLQRRHTSGLPASSSPRRASPRELVYNVVPTLVNAADYGVAQRRERVFLIGFRADLDARWAFPQPTHSLDALLYDQYVTQDYWLRHGVAARHRSPVSAAHAARVRALGEALFPPAEMPWVTVRDVIADLPTPRSGTSGKTPNHVLQEGARAYAGHTGSPLDLPAKTLKAGDHGVPGGENMLVKSDGSVRYFTVRESARLQTFPDGYRFPGSWTETMRQLGNAVPVLLAQRVAAGVALSLAGAALQSLAPLGPVGERRDFAFKQAA